jgi:DNA-binding phage protein
MSRALSPSVARCYGLARVARVWSISRASAYRALKETQPNTPRVALVRSAHVRTPNWQIISAVK